MKVEYPPEQYRKDVKNIYPNLIEAYVRELIQNSLDAGAKNIRFTVEEGKLTCSDDGHGMTLERFKECYLKIGGSYKQGSRSIGGFGAAKKLTFACQKWVIASSDFIVHGRMGYVDVDEEQARIGVYEGFRIVLIDEDHFKYTHRIESAIRRICILSTFKTKVFINNVEVDNRLKLKKDKIIIEDLGELSAGNENSVASSSYLYVLTDGLYSFNQYIGDGSYPMYLNLLCHPSKALTENRSGLKDEVYKLTYVHVTSRMESAFIKQANVEFTLFMPEEKVVHSEPQEILNESQEEQYDTVVLKDEGPERHTIQTELGRAIATKKVSDKFPFAIANVRKKPKPITPVIMEKVTLVHRIFKLLSLSAVRSMPIPGLILVDNAITDLPIYIEGKQVVFINQDVLDKHPFYIMEVLIHAFAHVWDDSHNNYFESRRLELIENIAPLWDDMYNACMLMSERYK